MANMFDYLKWRGDITFKVSPFNPVDNIILSQLSYLTLDDIVPQLKDKDGISLDLAVRIFNEKSKENGFVFTSQFKEDPDLIRALSVSKRFRNCQLFGYENIINKDLELQFSALCIYTEDNHCFVAFRGTDVSIVGWKEDFNMSFLDVIPSQLQAVIYLEKMAPLIAGDLRVGGHSKGGNLAVYASSQCDKKIQNRIKAVYTNDAPGFNDKFISSPGFAAIKKRIHSYVPQASVIGMLMENGWENNMIQSSGNGLMQHCLYLWDVTYNDLIPAGKATPGSQIVNKTIRDWLKNHDCSQREHLIEALYHILNAADLRSISEFEKSWLAATGRVLKSLKEVDEPSKKIIMDTLGEIFISIGKNIKPFIRNKTKN